MLRDIAALMRERRNLKAIENDDFSVPDTKQLAAALSSTTRVLTMLLGAVAAVRRFSGS